MEHHSYRQVSHIARAEPYGSRLVMRQQENKVGHTPHKHTSGGVGSTMQVDLLTNEQSASSPEQRMSDEQQHLLCTQIDQYIAFIASQNGVSDTRLRRAYVHGTIGRMSLNVHAYGANEKKTQQNKEEECDLLSAAPVSLALCTAIEHVDHPVIAVEQVPPRLPAPQTTSVFGGLPALQIPIAKPPTYMCDIEAALEGDMPLEEMDETAVNGEAKKSNPRHRQRECSMKYTDTRKTQPKHPAAQSMDVPPPSFYGVPPGLRRTPKIAVAPLTAVDAASMTTALPSSASLPQQTLPVVNGGVNGVGSKRNSAATTAAQLLRLRTHLIDCRSMFDIYARLARAVPTHTHHAQMLRLLRSLPPLPVDQLCVGSLVLVHTKIDVDDHVNVQPPVEQKEQGMMYARGMITGVNELSRMSTVYLIDHGRTLTSPLPLAKVWLLLLLLLYQSVQVHALTEYFAREPAYVFRVSLRFDTNYMLYQKALSTQFGTPVETGDVLTRNRDYTIEFTGATMQQDALRAQRHLHTMPRFVAHEIYDEHNRSFAEQCAAYGRKNEKRTRMTWSQALSALGHGNASTLATAPLDISVESHHSDVEEEEEVDPDVKSRDLHSSSDSVK